MDQLRSRREFLKQTALNTGALPLLVLAAPERFPISDATLPDIHIFSKHLQFLNYADMADAAADMGFAGVDLTVRPDGHVRPDRVEEDLPKAVEALKTAGLAPNLMTTAIGDATDITSVRILETAAQSGFQTYRMAWYQYDEKETMPEAILRFQQQLKNLGELNKTLNLMGCYQNHAGQLVGASVWEIWEMLKTADPHHMGVQYDIRHATVEGGLSWPSGLRLLRPQIKSIVLKDCIWAKRGGRWVVQDVPIGEGMVDFKAYFQRLKQDNLQVPVSLHAEYTLGGAEHGATRLTIPKQDVFKAIRRDLNRVHELWKAA